VSLATRAAVEVEGKEVEVGVKAIGDSRCFFSLSPPSLYPPVPHFWIFVPNFTNCHGNSTVSAFISNPTAAHGPHQPSIGFPFHVPQDLRMRSLRGEYCYVL